MTQARCNRNGCTRAMCDRHSLNYGYICSDCFSELIDLGPETVIEEFLNSPKRPSREERAQAKFGGEFEIRKGLML
jgi:hypothetical protein